MNIIITSLDETQWQDLRNLRLEALNTDPLAFGASFEEEADLPNDMWQKFSQNMLVAICDNKLIGMVGLLPQEEKSCKHWGIVISLWVKSGFRNHKVGKRLLEKLFERAQIMGLRKVLLKVVVTQTEAIKLYEKTGFSLIGRLKEHFFKNNTYYDAFLMERYLTQERR